MGGISASGFKSSCAAISTGRFSETGLVNRDDVAWSATFIKLFGSSVDGAISGALAGVAMEEETSMVVLTRKESAADTVGAVETPNTGVNEAPPRPDATDIFVTGVEEVVILEFTE